VFHLVNSDPLEMTDLLTQLFPDQTRTSGGGRSSIMFGGMGGRGMMGMQRSGNSQASAYAQKKGQVVAVPDQRTSSVIVSASSEMMPQIGAMIAQLDANPAKAQKVYVYPLENADVANVETILRGMFEGQNSRNTRSTTSSQQNNQLSNRSLFNQGQQNSSRTSTRSSSRGSSGGF
jgi:type II secretory pathway component GspD/PulD (secretin)